MFSFSLYLVFTTSFFLHLTSRFPVLGAIRFDLILVGVLLVLCLLAISDIWERYHDSEIARKLVVFVCYFLLTIPLVKWPGSVIKYGTEWYLKVVVFYFFTLAFVTTEKRLKIFVAVFLACQFFRGLEPAWLHYTTGYWGDVACSMVGGHLNVLNRLSGAPHDIVNPNQLAWVIVNTVPFIFFFGWFRRGVISRSISLLISVPLLYALMLTGSRSGLVILFVVFVGFVYFSENRKRNFLVLSFVVLPVAIIVSGLLSPDMAERYRSLVDSSAVGADTAHGRLQGLLEKLSTVMDVHGFFGYGLGTNREVNVNCLGGRLMTHNLYIEILQEVGVFGFLIFIRYIVSIFKNLKSFLKKRHFIERDDFLSRTIRALLVWQFMQLVYAISCFGLSSWEWYLFGGVATVAVTIENKRLNQENFS
jgi:O-antigen ligase